MLKLLIENSTLRADTQVLLVILMESSFNEFSNAETDFASKVTKRVTTVNISDHVIYKRQSYLLQTSGQH